MSQHPPTEALRAAERGIQSTVCAGISALVRQRWGRGPKRSRAYWAGPDALLVLLDDAHTEPERTLLGRGYDAEVLAGRRRLGEIAEPDLRAIAEEATGRRVHAVLSQTSVDPPVTTIVFLLDAERGGDRGEDRLGDALREALSQRSAAQALVAESQQASRQSDAMRETARQAGRRARRPPPPRDA